MSAHGIFRTRREARRFVRSPGEQTSRRKAATFVFDHQKQTSAPAWQVGKVSKREQRVQTGCDPLAAERRRAAPLGASPDGPTRGRFGRDVEMQLFTLSITDLTTFESVPHEEWAEKEDLFEIGNHFARVMFAVNPSFCRRGMCVAIYDEAGIVSVMPLDTLQ